MGCQHSVIKNVSVSSARRVFTGQTEAENVKCRYLGSARPVMGTIESATHQAILKMYIVTLVENMESKLFNSVRYNTNHVSHQLLPPEKDIHYNLRQRSHSLRPTLYVC